MTIMIIILFYHRFSVFIQLILTFASSVIRLRINVKFVHKWFGLFGNTIQLHKIIYIDAMHICDWQSDTEKVTVL